MKMKGKVGVVTLPGQFNYGNRLQNYAVVKTYEKIGFEAVSLELDDHKILRSIKRGVMAALGKRLETNEDLMTEERLKAFNNFSKTCNPCVVENKSGAWRGNFTVFSTGSDQVWNPDIAGRKTGWYFLDFAKKSQRIALAPSIGISSLDDAQARTLAEGVKGFPRVSVREKRGAELIMECSGVDAEVICDPTLTLSAEEWRAVADGRCTPAEPYVFTYLLGGVGAEAAEVLDKLTDHGRVPVVPLSDRQKPEEPDAGPAEFIDLIDHATHVVTDSFHAAVFSSILHVPLTIVHREGGVSMFSRLEQLSQMLGIEEKVFGAPEFDLARAGEYEGVDAAIGLERDKFMTYLNGCLDD